MPSTSQQNLYVFVHDGEVYTSPKHSFIPEVPDRQSRICDDPDASDVLQTYWADSRFPTHAFTPLSPRLDVEPYKLLRIPDDRIAVKTGASWQMKPSLMQGWRVLESHLLVISNTLFNRSEGLLPLDSRTFPPPSKYGYTRDHKTRRGALISASKSRDAFFWLMGWCTYTICLFRGSMGRPWQWERILLENRCPNHMVQSLAESELLDLSPEYRRAGVFVDHTCTFISSIKRMIQLNVPVWIHWGSLNKAGPLIPALASYRPTLDQLNQAPRTFSAKAATPRPISPIFSAVDLETASSGVVLPKPERNSRQKHGETWQAFFVRMAERNTRAEATESSDARKARFAREDREKDHRRPAKSSKGPTIFHWAVDAASNFRMRTKMSKREVDDDWSRYTNTQRRYDSFHNEWDICTEFDPDAYAPEVDEDEDDHDDTNGNDYDVSNPSTNQLQKYALSIEQPAHYDTSQDEDEQVVDDSFSLTFADTIADMAYERYGFLNSVDLALESDPPSAAEWKKVLRTFCKKSSEGDKRLRGAIKLFMNKLLDGKPLGALSDLAHDSNFPLLEHANKVFRVSPLSVHLQSGEFCSFYLIEARDRNKQDAPWQLVVKDAATALDCLRGYHDTTPAIIRFMVQSGRVFSTRSSLDVLQAREEPRRWHQGFSLGWREPANRPQLSEYTSYERLRAEFFRQPHARAALMKGGIIWRLALEHAQGLAEELVLEGPSDEVLMRGTCWRLPVHTRSNSMWDDDLSSDELDFICGVYKLYTSEGGRNTADVSWWPKHSTFMSSGLNVGHWTDGCEEWFQTRHAMIVEGKANLKTATQWFNALKYEKKTKHLVRRNIEEAEGYLMDKRSAPLRM